MLEMLSYTAAAVVLYSVSAWILNRIETLRGVRFPNRSLIFFLIILTLSVVSFQTIQYFLRS